MCGAALAAGTVGARVGGGTGMGAEAATVVSVKGGRRGFDVFETDEAKQLLESGRAVGKLSADDIAAALDELELDTAQLDEFYAALEEQQIEVVERVDEEAEAEAETNEVS